MALYCNVVELERAALSHESTWCTWAIVRHNVIADISGGWSALLAALIRSELLGESSLTAAGATVMLPDGPAIIFLRLKLILGDLDALRQAFDMKGSAGLKPCLLCQNVVAKGSDLASRDGRLVEISCHNVAEFQLSTTADIHLNYDVCAAADARRVAGRMTKVMYDNIERTCGFTYNPRGLLAAADLRDIVRPDDMVVFDSMHCFFLNWYHQ